MKTFKTTIANIPVELEIVKIGPASFDEINNLKENLEKDVVVIDGNGGAQTNPIITKDSGARVISVGNEEKPATPEDVVKITNAISKTDTVTLITNLADCIQNAPEGKEFWQSRVVWLNVIAIVASVAAHFGFDFKAHNIDENTVVTVITTIVGLANLYFRKGTSQPLNPVMPEVKRILNK